MTEPEAIHLAEAASAAGQRLYVVRYRGGFFGICARDPAKVRGARVVWDSVGGLHHFQRHQRGVCVECSKDRVICCRGVCYRCWRAGCGAKYPEGKRGPRPRILPAIAVSA